MQRQPDYRRLAAHLKAGGLIAYPTESCFGLGCDPSNRAAVQRLLKLKQRPQCKGLIIIAFSCKQLTRYLPELSEEQQQKLHSDGAKAITYLMPVRPSTPHWLRGCHDTLAIRLTAHPVARSLCRGVRSALVSTSANQSGMRPARSYAECQRLFGHAVWVLPGLVGKRRQPSRIVSWSDGRVLRN